MTEYIFKFDGEHSFLSNFYAVPIPYEGYTYGSVENAFQAAKTLDPYGREPFVCCSPGQAKRFGRTLHLRSDWEVVKIGIMEQLLREKFSYPALKKKLLDTNNAQLIEGNTWGDRTWGAVWSPKSCSWEGKNLLGNLLMRIREDLRRGEREHQ